MVTFIFPDVLQHGPNGFLSIFQYYFWALVIILGLVAIFLIYRFFFPKLNRVRANEKVITKKTIEESIVKNEEKDVKNGGELKQESPIKSALRLLEPDERKVVDAIIEAGGSLLQKEISWKTGFSRVKTHRVLVRLIRRGVVTSEKYYNTNKITIAEWLHNYD